VSGVTLGAFGRATKFDEKVVDIDDFGKRGERIWRRENMLFLNGVYMVGVDI
jgi:hypothetical protein